MSLWINSKGWELLWLLIEKNTRLCFASAQILQWNYVMSNPLNKEGNMIFKTLKEGWPRWKWWSQMASLFEELRNDKDKLFMTLFEKPGVSR